MLDIPQVEPPEVPAPASTLTPALLSSIRTEITEILATLSQPTYCELTVTDIAKQGKAPTREATGKGSSWGNVIHQYLELLAKNQTLHIPNILTANGRDPLEEQQVSDILSKVTGTLIWHRAMAAAERYTEVPFGIRTDTLYLTGAIDLAFHEP